MGGILNWIRSEPVAIAALVVNVLALLGTFGLNISQDQQAALIVVVNSVLAAVARSSVKPTVKLNGNGE